MRILRLGDTLIDKVEGWRGVIVGFTHKDGFAVDNGHVAAMATVELKHDGTLSWMTKGSRILVDIRPTGEGGANEFDEEVDDVVRTIRGRDV